MVEVSHPWAPARVIVAVMSAKKTATETLKRNKTKLIDVLCMDYPFILNKVQENKLITSREYTNLKSINKEHVAGHVVELVDKIMNKGEETCQNFLELLQTDDIVETYPGLKSMKLHDVLLKPVQATSPCSGNKNACVAYLYCYSGWGKRFNSYGFAFTFSRRGAWS